MAINYKEKYNEYHNKFWKLHHTNKDLSSEISELKMKLEIYERRTLYGKIKMISVGCDWGLITNLEYGDIFFHKSKCSFPLSNILIEKSVNYNLTITKKFEAHNVSLENMGSAIQNPFDILDMISYLPTVTASAELSVERSVAPTLGQLTAQDDPCLDMIEQAQDIWYMNSKYPDNKENWQTHQNCIDNGFVTTWNKDGRNNSLHEKLKVNDIIAWYAIGRGYIAILKVIGEVCKLTEDDLTIFKRGDKKAIKEHLEWEKETNCSILKISVQYLSHCPMNNCIHELDGFQGWTSGFRGPCAMRPKNKKWKEQVIGMYLEMKDKNDKNEWPDEKLALEANLVWF